MSADEKPERIEIEVTLPKDIFREGDLLVWRLFPCGPLDPRLPCTSADDDIEFEYRCAKDD